MITKKVEFSQILSTVIFFFYYSNSSFDYLLRLYRETFKILDVDIAYQIKCYLSHAPNTTGVGRPYSEMLTYKPLSNNAVKKNTFKKI